MNFFQNNAQQNYTWDNVGKAIIDVFMNEKLTSGIEKKLNDFVGADQNEGKFVIKINISLKQIRKRIQKYGNLMNVKQELRNLVNNYKRKQMINQSQLDEYYLLINKLISEGFSIIDEKKDLYEP